MPSLQNVMLNKCTMCVIRVIGDQKDGLTPFNHQVWFMVFNVTFNNISVISWRFFLIIRQLCLKTNIILVLLGLWFTVFALILFTYMYLPESQI